jgi:hypothetical protein
MWLGTDYLAVRRLKKSPLDAVARFHLRNGASMHRINWMGNGDINGLKASAGLMVNYLYDLDKLRERAENFQDTGGDFHIGDGVDLSRH